MINRLKSVEKKKQANVNIVEKDKVFQNIHSFLHKMGQSPKPVFYCLPLSSSKCTNRNNSETNSTAYNNLTGNSVARTTRNEESKNSLFGKMWEEYKRKVDIEKEHSKKTFRQDYKQSRIFKHSKNPSYS